MSEYILRTKDLCKSYNNKLVVDHVNMEIKRGQIYGFIGKNGAGKTTLMRMVCNLASVTSGKIELFGSTDIKEIQKWRKKLGTIIEYPSLFLNMTAEENMETQRRITGNRNPGSIKDTLKFVGLGEVGNKKVKAFSLGMKQRLAMALALLNEPEFLVLDEPINGMDPTGIAEVRETLKRLSTEKNITILISSHILAELNLLATHYGIINNGKLIRQISSEDLKNACKQYLRIDVDDVNKASNILRNKLNINSFNVVSNTGIQIFEYEIKPSVINRALVLEDVRVDNISVQGQDLEKYFIQLVGE